MRGLTRIGVKLPSFRLATLGGRSTSLDDLLGRKLLFFLWSSWDASRDELQRLEEFHREHGRRIRVVAITFDVGGPAMPNRYLRAARASFDCLIDSTGHLCRKWGIRQVPAAVLADERGRILHLGDRPDAEFLKRAVESLELPPQDAEGEARVEGAPIQLEIQLQTAGTYLSRKRVDEALELLNEAQKLDARNEIIRRNAWALKNPERFYEGAIDAEWLRRAQSATTRRRTTRA